MRIRCRSSDTTFRYRTMKDTIPTSVDGNRNRSSPASNARGAVVADSTIHEPSTPDSDSETPSTSIRGPVATKGNTRANTTNGVSTASLLTTTSGGSLASTTHPTSRTAYRAKAQKTPAGVDTTASTKTKRATIFTCAGSRWIRLSTATSRPSPADPLTAASGGLVGARGRPQRRHLGDRQPDRDRHQYCDDAR